MTSRLDRLFILIENSGSSVTRKVAAQQLGEIVRQHPNELGSLLDRLHSCIVSKSWETRIAAGQAVEALANNVPQLQSESTNIKKEDEVEEKKYIGRIALSGFSITEVLKKGSCLLSTDQNNFINSAQYKGDLKEHLISQRQLINQRLGLEVADGLGFDTKNLFTNEDLKSENVTAVKSEPEFEPKEHVFDVVNQEMGFSGLSSREINRAKRKARMYNKQKSCEPTVEDKEDGRCAKKIKRTLSLVEEHSSCSSDDASTQNQEWPFADFCDLLITDIFSTEWETRHGAATALREVVKAQGKCAGFTTDNSLEQNKSSHDFWLEDVAVRLCCVLALDRFGDFISDQVVAPVRETAAQVLGSVLHHMNKDGVDMVLSILQEMMSWTEWETRHGGLLGLKYLLAVRNEDRHSLLKSAFHNIYKGLQDIVDDVVAVAASCLVPVADDLAYCLPEKSVAQLVDTLWQSLLDIDDLTASTNSALLLLSKLLSHPKVPRNMGSLSELVPRLWPFLYHTSASVRKSALMTLSILTCSPQQIENQNKLPNFSNGSAESQPMIISEALETSEQITDKEELISQTTTEEGVNTDAYYETNSINKEGVENNVNNVSVKAKEETIEDKMNNSEKMVVEESEPSQSNCDDKIINTDDQPTNSTTLTASETSSNDNFLQINKSTELSNWLVIVLKDLITHIYQRSLMESSSDNLILVTKIWEHTLKRVPLNSLLVIVCPQISSWLCLIMINSRQGLDPSLLLIPQHYTENINKLSTAVADQEDKVTTQSQYYLGGLSSLGEVQENPDVAVKARLTASKLLGILSHYLTLPMPGMTYKNEDEPLLCYIQLLVTYFTSRSAMQRIGAGLVTRDWAYHWRDRVPDNKLLESSLQDCLTNFVYYDEIALSFTRLQQDVRDFVALMRHYKLECDDLISNSVMTLEQIQQLCNVKIPQIIKRSKLRPRVLETLESRRKTINGCVSKTTTDHIILSLTTQGVLAGATISLRKLPDNLNPVVKPLMDSLKKQPILLYQEMAAKDISNLLKLCVKRTPCPNNKILKNLSLFLCVDYHFTPLISNKDFFENESSKKYSIFLLLKQNYMIKYNASEKQNTKADLSEKKSESCEKQKQSEIQRRGCTVALHKICLDFGESIPEALPQLWELITYLLCSPVESLLNDEQSQRMVNWLQLLEILIPKLHYNLLNTIISKLTVLTTFLEHEYSAVRHLTSRVIAELTVTNTLITMKHVIQVVIPMLNKLTRLPSRQGAVECLHFIAEKLNLNIVPYIVFLIVPLLGRNGDPNEHVRLIATQTFASLLKLLPLEGGVPEPDGFDSFLIEEKVKQKLFLDQLLNFDKAETYSLPIPIKAKLRSYQQDGVNWLAFLNRYELHGILCDDMGLGKTLQSICILAGDHYKLKQTPSGEELKSLVICPPTLTGHWVYEIEKFVEHEYLSPLHYTGTPCDRIRLRSFFSKHNLIVASYDIVRNEIDFFSKIQWNYVVLDEGHVIKNGKTKSARAIKQLTARHRLMLTGTPIQNNVLELWSLFDFLIPGFLGTEKQFIARYSKPILLSRDPKSSSKEQENGVLAMEALHRQVLPFILRRVKDDVLKDLPPKIIQDYYCVLSPLQQQIYEDFAQTRAKHSIVESLHGKELEEKSNSHIFQALQYLRRVCNHPKLVLKLQHPEYDKIMQQLQQQNSSLDDIHHSSKLPALKQLLLDCGIGVTRESTNIMSPHRALIFCQLKTMLDIIENDLLKRLMPTVTYIRLDGSVPAGLRHNLVQQFNSDPSIDVFLLTTQVGGLGLNLTGADTVIFVEHDWNPMRDLQAMDRAHRIGQKRVVNVYRLITRNTLEEKIMGLQKFKIMTANTVISKDNSSMLSMDTDQLLDLFVLDPNKSGPVGCSETYTTDGKDKKEKIGSQLLGFKGGVKNILENLPDLWDESQYESEYDLNNFMLSLK